MGRRPSAWPLAFVAGGAIWLYAPLFALAACAALFAVVGSVDLAVAVRHWRGRVA